MKPRTIATSNRNRLAVEFEIPKDWISYVTIHDDLFMRNYCGYWARGCEWDRRYGYLVFEHGGEKRHPEPTPPAILKAWKSGDKLPRGWFRFDRDLARFAFAEGVKLRGVEWYTDGQADASFYDCLIQLVIFHGEEKYG